MRASMILGVCFLLWAVSLRADEPDTPYLMSVSFSVPSLDQWTPEVVRQFYNTPYRGIAAKVHTSYDRKLAPKAEDFAAPVALLKAGKPDRHVWPWVFLNTIIAPNPEHRHKSAPKAADDVGFRGMDLDGSGGALDVFCGTWRTALRLARELGAPGIVFDPEAYNDYTVESIRYLSQTSGKPSTEVVRLLRGIGARMADIAAEEFPNAIVWSLFTQLDADPDLCTTVPILLDGMLTRAKENGIPLALVDGGETVGYAFINLQELDRRHNLRAFHVSKYLQKYGERLVMGCTIAPWADAKERTSWMAEWPSCTHSTFQTIADFEPVFTTLMRRYKYFWIYAASAAPYNPLKPESAARYNPTIEKALAEAKRLGPLPPPKAPALSDLTAALPLTKDLAADMNGWTIGGGPEASLSPLTTGEGGPGVRFRVQVDTKGGDEKYPSGWLFLNRDLTDTGDLSGAIGVRFQVRFQQEGKIRIGLREKTGGNVEWVSLFPEKVGEWRDVAIPIESFAVQDPKEIHRLSFYIAEAWYLHGDALTFDVRKVFFCRKSDLPAPHP